MRENFFGEIEVVIYKIFLGMVLVICGVGGMGRLGDEGLLGGIRACGCFGLGSSWGLRSSWDLGSSCDLGSSWEGRLFVE